MDPIAAGNSAYKRTILVVEDERLMLRLLEKVFSREGYQVLAVPDGEEAVEVYHRYKLKIDAVLLDVGLPKMTGWQVLSNLKQENPDVRVVIASGYLEPKRKAEMSTVGVNGFVNKPYRIDELVKTIRNVIEKNEQ